MTEQFRMCKSAQRNASSQLDQHRPQTWLAVFSLTGSLIPVQHQDRAEPPLRTTVKTVMTGEPPCPPLKSKLTCTPIPPSSSLGGQDLYPIPICPGGIDNIGDKSYSTKFTPHIYILLPVSPQKEEWGRFPVQISYSLYRPKTTRSIYRPRCVLSHGLPVSTTVLASDCH